MERISYQEVPKEMINKLMDIELLIKNSGLSTHLLELLRLRVAQKNGCAYCVDMHHKELKHLNETEVRLSSVCVWEDTPYYTPIERCVLAYADSLTRLTRGPLADQVFDALLIYFSKQEICYLTLAITQINTWTRLMKSFQFTPGKYKVQNG